MPSLSPIEGTGGRIQGLAPPHRGLGGHAPGRFGPQRPGGAPPWFYGKATALLSYSSFSARSTRGAENTNGVLRVGSDSTRADGYYHWGALHALVAMAGDRGIPVPVSAALIGQPSVSEGALRLLTQPALMQERSNVLFHS